jgi:hypothetical protein
MVEFELDREGINQDYMEDIKVIKSVIKRDISGDSLSTKEQDKTTQRGNNVINQFFSLSRHKAAKTGCSGIKRLKTRLKVYYGAKKIKCGQRLWTVYHLVLKTIL